MKQVTGNNPNIPHLRTSIQLNLGGFSVISPSVSQVVTRNIDQLPSLVVSQNQQLKLIWNVPAVTLVPSHLFTPNNAHDFLLAAGFCNPNSTALYCQLANNITIVWAANNQLLETLNDKFTIESNNHPLELLLQNFPQSNKTIILLDNSLIHIATFANGQLLNALSAPITSALDTLYFISQSTVATTLIELYGDVTSDVKILINKHFKTVKCFTQQHYCLIHFHNQK